MDLAPGTRLGWNLCEDPSPLSLEVGIPSFTRSPRHSSILALPQIAGWELHFRGTASGAVVAWVWTIDPQGAWHCGKRGGQVRER